MAKTLDQRLTAANLIKSETIPNANTAPRVGGAMEDMNNAWNEETGEINVTTAFPPVSGYHTAETARNVVLESYRRKGRTITYQTAAGTWVKEQFRGDSTATWLTASNWYPILMSADQDVYNVTNKVPLAAGEYYNPTTARNAVPAQIRKLGLGLKYLSGYREIDTLTITGPAITDGNIIIFLNGVQNTASPVIIAGNTSIEVATKIRTLSWPGWTTGGTAGTAVVTFTRTTYDAVSAPTFSNTAGITATFARTSTGQLPDWIHEEFTGQSTASWTTTTNWRKLATSTDIAYIETDLNGKINELEPTGWYDTLTVTDRFGNAIVDIESGVQIDKNGNIKTKSIEQENKFDSQLQISDNDDNVILDLRNGLKVDEYGNIITKLFNSSDSINYSSYDIGKSDLMINKKYMKMPIVMLSKKIVDKTNRFVVSFNGDSIIGSQLDDIAHSAEYDTGAYPPNMSKNIMARKFYDKYKFQNEDTVFRNLEHPEWIKSGFNINKGKGDKTKVSNFNELELWGCASTDDYAQITITGYKYFKLIWSRASTSDLWACSLNVSVNGGPFITPTAANISLPDTFGKEDINHNELQVYSVCKLDAAKTYVFKINSASNYANVTFWGCEYWNNPRLDVVVEAFSGTTAKIQVEKMQEAYCSAWHKPMLIISDILVKNDESWIIGGNDTIDIWMKSNAILYNLCKDNGIPLLLIAPHQVTTEVLAYAASGLAISLNTPVIDIIKLLVEDSKTAQYVVNLSDGQHLSDVGNSYYFSKIEQIFS